MTATRSAPTMRNVIKVHRYLGLAALVFWVLQALSGILISFNWEMDDALLSRTTAPFDAQAIGARIEAMEDSGDDVSSIWTSGSGRERFDVYLDGPGGEREIRIDGAGNVLRVQSEDTMFANGSWIETLVTFHQTLLADDLGSWIVGISGALLFSNIVAGVVIARPWQVGWRRSLLPTRRGPGRTRAYSWHRAVGLWAAIPALLMIGAGVLLVFYDTVDAAVSPPPRTLPAHAVDAPIRTGFGEAVATALGQYDGATLTAVTLPTENDKAYLVRMRRPGEGRKIYGMTTVIVDATNGAVLGQFDALNDGAARSFVDGLFPMHTGELGGLFGRIAAMMVGVWLLAMIWLGVWQWRARTRR